MKNYIAPEMEVSKFNLSDVLTTSGGILEPIVEMLSNAGAYDGALPSKDGVKYVD